MEVRIIREIIIIRKRCLLASLVKADIILDGVVAAKVKNGETIRLSVEDGEHEIFTNSAMGKGNTLRIESGSEDVVLHIKVDSTQFKLVSETGMVSSEDADGKSNTCDIEPRFSPKSQVISYVCGIIISLILIGICTLLYLIKETSLIGFIAGSIFSIASGVVFIIGGFWIVVIPLPFIYFWKTGCLKPNQSTKRRIFLGILSFVLIVLAFAALIILKDVNLG